MLNIQKKEQILSAYKNIQLTRSSSQRQQRRVKRISNPSNNQVFENHQDAQILEPFQPQEDVPLQSEFASNRRTKTSQGTSRIKKYISLYGKSAANPQSVEGRRQISLVKHKKIFAKQSEENNGNANDLQSSEGSKSSKYLSYNSKVSYNGSTPTSRPISSIAKGGRVMTASSQSTNNPRQRDISTTTETNDQNSINQK